MRERWQEILWREWYTTEDEEFAEQIYDSLAGESVGKNQIMSLIIWSFIHGSFFGIFLRNIYIVFVGKSQIPIWICVLFGGLISVIGMLITIYFQKRFLSWNAYLRIKIPIHKENAKPESTFYALFLSSISCVAGVVVGLWWFQSDPAFNFRVAVLCSVISSAVCGMVMGELKWSVLGLFKGGILGNFLVEAFVGGNEISFGLKVGFIPIIFLVLDTLMLAFNSDFDNRIEENKFLFKYTIALLNGIIFAQLGFSATGKDTGILIGFVVGIWAFILLTLSIQRIDTGEVNFGILASTLFVAIAGSMWSTQVRVQSVPFSWLLSVLAQYADGLWQAIVGMWVFSAIGGLVGGAVLGLLSALFDGVRSLFSGRELPTHVYAHDKSDAYADFFSLFVHLLTYSLVFCFIIEKLSINFTGENYVLAVFGTLSAIAILGIIIGIVFGLRGIIVLLYSSPIARCVTALQNKHRFLYSDVCYLRRYEKGQYSPPLLTEIERALHHAPAPLSSLLRHLDDARARNPSLQDLIEWLQSNDFQQRFVASILIIEIGSEAIPSLVQLVHTYGKMAHTVQRILCGISHETKKKLLYYGESKILCSKCIARFTEHTVQLAEHTFNYYCCRHCGQSRGFFVVNKSIAVLDDRMIEERVLRGDILEVNYILHGALFDFDTVEIRSASETAVKRFLEQVSNDEDKERRKKRSHIICYVSKECALRTEDISKLSKLFGKVVIK